ncbi:sugar transporter erd6-like 3 [Quercus suber]|uniref:Sugar transporter erd6-like 3 n=1 Tax=Quercus suber TaxID=58331 RepID=A0AAW0JUN4_QUESU
MICCGISLTYLIGAFLNWRTLALNGKLPCSCLVFLSFEGSFMPSTCDLTKMSNCYKVEKKIQALTDMAKIGRKKECEATLQHLRRQNADITLEATEIRLTRNGS